MMWVVGITGQSGSGKSSLSAYYASLGFATEDGDLISRAVCLPGSACLAELCSAFGADIVDEKGALKRRALGEKVYANEGLNEKLLGIVHPYILEELLQRKEQEEARGGRFLFLDGAMIVGSIFEKYCQKLILVQTEKSQSLKRVKARDGVSQEVAERRLAAQKHQEELQRVADYIVHNDADLQSLHKQAAHVLQKLQCAQMQSVL